jgi:hypothetical protein
LKKFLWVQFWFATEVNKPFQGSLIKYLLRFYVLE